MKIIAKTWNQKTHNFRIESKDTILKLKYQIMDKLNYKNYSFKDIP
jgi:hypothetical protein